MLQITTFKVTQFGKTPRYTYTKVNLLTATQEGNQRWTNMCVDVQSNRFRKQNALICMLNELD